MRNQHDAEDIVQECYRKLLVRSAHYDLPRDGDRLLYRSITNACINHVQRRPPEVDAGDFDRIVSPPFVEDGQTAEARLIQQELKSEIAIALARLPVQQRAVVELASLGHSLVDVAEMAGVSHANARVLLHRARQALAESLKRFREGEVR